MAQSFITIDSKKIGEGYPPFLVAEMSANHNGTLQKALQMIKTAKTNGADAIKIQTYTPETMTIDCSKPDFIIRGGLWDGYKLYDLYDRAHTPYEWHKTLFDAARSADITIFSTPFDESAIDLLEDLGVCAYKIASFEIVDLALIKYAASTKKPLIISTGTAQKSEIDEALSAARESGATEIALLHCVSAYPTPVCEARLNMIDLLAKRYKTVVGLSDHTLGTTAAIAAVALGARLIEKHFTLSRASGGADSAFSIEPNELKLLSKQINEAYLALGGGAFERSKAEESSLRFRRSLYFVKDIKAGEKITAEHIRKIRPGMGLAPKFFDAVIGAEALIDIERGTPVTPSALKANCVFDTI
ncbi:MAG: pseudaminic acid synthase [Helicobacteraceae bacterium]|jgi:N-acetylneuraminate synthase|nr:pseudaminic acid synthase [Helicobacteraceae bacterium]